MIKGLNILAMDQARNGAWSVYNYEKQELVAYGVYNFDSKKYTYAKAILKIEELMASLIDEYGVEGVFVEDIQLRTNPQAFKRLAQLQGVLVNYCEKNELMYGYVTPTQWQSFCKVSKERLAEYIEIEDLAESKKSKCSSMCFVKDNFGIETHDDNIADAICIGYYVVNILEIERV